MASHLEEMSTLLGVSPSGAFGQQASLAGDHSMNPGPLSLAMSCGAGHRSYNGQSMFSDAPSNVPQSASASTSHREGMKLGTGAAGTVRIIHNSAGEPMYAEKRISTTTTQKASTALTELSFAQRQLGWSEINGAQPEHLLRIESATHDEQDNSVRVRMEFMDAGSVAALAPVVDDAVLGEIAAQVIAGLRVLHGDLRVLHRDLKPENVLMARDGRVKIADFGVAAVLGPGQATADDQQGTILQMAPERLRGEAHGPASDVWSLGVTVAQLALGRHPFVPSGVQAGSTERFWLLAEVIKHTGTAEECEAATRAAVEGALAGRGAALVGFVHRCTATDPARRPSLDELARHPLVADSDHDARYGALVSSIAVCAALGGSFPVTIMGSSCGDLPPAVALATTLDEWD